MIQISHLTKKYNDNIAVDDLSLEIPKGSMFGFLGSNGAGGYYNRLLALHLLTVQRLPLIPQQ